MHFILAAAFVVTTVFAIPLLLQPELDTTNLTIHTRGAVGAGTDSGIAITLYGDAKCKGGVALKQEMYYDNQYAQQFKSYSLSDTIGDDDVLSVYADIGWSATSNKGIQSALDGNTNAACAQFVYYLEETKTTKGCHSLPSVVGCITIAVSASSKG